MKRLPELKQVGLRIQQISQLKTATLRLPGGPAPNLSLEEQR
ncbi:MAG: hypothetical protein AAGI23_14750 [Bacteroidota bacterium]